MAGGHGWVPAANSPLEYVRSRLKRKFGPAGPWNGDEAESAGRLATLMLAVSGQHLEGIRELLLARQVVFPVAPLARSIVESAGRTFWLLDPRNTELRHLAARMWMVRLENVTRQVTTAKRLTGGNNRSLEALVEAKKRVRQVEIPNRFFPSEVENKDGVVTIRGQHFPGLSGGLKHIAAGMGVEDWHTPMYAFLSDATHPTPYTALETLQPAGSSRDKDLHKFGSTGMRREYMIYQAAVHAYQQSWYLTTSYFGLDTTSVIDVCDKVDHLPKPD
jgi:hypothetical protein